MNRVGHEGRGESVWVGWFLDAMLPRLRRRLPRRAATRERAGRYRAAGRAARARRSSSAAWDGDWYRRAYFDDGTPLGSAANEECRIDSIAQSWARHLRAPATRSARRQAMAVGRASTWCAREDGLILLFTPPFDRTAARPRLHQGLPAGRARERRPVHARRDLDGARLRAARRRRPGGRALRHAQPDQPRPHAGGGRSATRSSPTSSRPTSTPSPPHTGRGGWTWYTGSAGWMYRVGARGDPRLPPPRRVLHGRARASRRAGRSTS